MQRVGNLIMIKAPVAKLWIASKFVAQRAENKLNQNPLQLV